MRQALPNERMSVTAFVTGVITLWFFFGTFALFTSDLPLVQSVILWTVCSIIVVGVAGFIGSKYGFKDTNAESG